MKIDDRFVWLSIAWLLFLSACTPPCEGTRDPTNGACLNCGVSGFPCCTGSGTPPCQGTLRCSAGTCTVCGGIGESCCGSGTACDTGAACRGGICVTCGQYGEPCCGGSSCQGHLVCGGGVCQGCQDECGAGTTCQLGSCVRCGSAGQPCCEDATPCTGPNTTCVASSDSGSTCTACGAQGEPCCPLFECDQSGTAVCAHTMEGPTGYRCVRCGGFGAPCCEGMTPCNSGLSCDSMLTCVSTCGGDGQPCCAGWPPCRGASRCAADRCTTPPSLAGQPCGADSDCGTVLHCDLTRAMPVCTGACDPLDDPMTACDGVAACGGLPGRETCGPACGATTGCTGGTSCVAGACIPRCSTDADCAIGLHCNPRIGTCGAEGDDPSRLLDGRPCLVPVTGGSDPCRGACIGAPAIPGAPEGEGICVSLPPLSGRCPDRGVVVGAAALCDAVLCYDNCDCNGLSCSADHLCGYPRYSPTPGECPIGPDAGTDASSDGSIDDAGSTDSDTEAAPPDATLDAGIDASAD